MMDINVRIIMALLEEPGNPREPEREAKLVQAQLSIGHHVYLFASQDHFIFRVHIHFSLEICTPLL